MEDPNNIYIGRKGIVILDKQRFPPQASIWANPFKVSTNKSRQKIIEEYEEYIRKKIKDDPEKYNIENLRGKKLGCWCAPDACHGDVLIKILNETEK